LNAQQLHGALTDCSILVGQYAGSEASKAQIALLDILIAGYRCDLETVKSERLIALQAQVQQCHRLRDVLTGVPHADPRI
jgi:hypothetical protein